MTTIEPAAREDPREWVQTLIEMVDDGWTITAAAIALDVSVARAYDALHPKQRAQSKNGHKARARNREGVRCSRCGELMTYRSKLEQPLCRPCRYAMGREHDEQIIELWRQGYTRDAIADKLGIENDQYVSTRIGNIRARGIELERRR